MRVLVGCEESQTVCKAFRAKGHEAFSCDIEPCSGGHPEWHIQKNVLDILEWKKWDLMISHPPCTFLTNAGVRWLYQGGTKKNPIDEVRWQNMVEGCEFFNELWKCNIPKICVENPIPHIFARERIGYYEQVIQPWQHGHPERKATCLWLKGLPRLKETNNVKSHMLTLSKKDQNKIHNMSPGPERSKLRSKTYEGIAKAFAEAWG